MSLIPIVQGGHSTASGFDTTLIANSIWWEGSGTSGDSLTRSWGTPSNQDRWIWSTWYCPLREADSTGNRGNIFAAGSASNGFYLIHTSNDSTFGIFHRDEDGNEGAINTTESYRDLGRWLHLLVDYDSANSTADDRISLYVNGVKTGVNTGTRPGSGKHINVNVSGQTHRIGQDLSSTPDYHASCYLSQTLFLDNKSIAAGDYSITDFLGTPFAFGTNGSQITPKSDAEITAIANAGGDQSNLLLYTNASDIDNDASNKNSGAGNDWSTSTVGSANQSANTPSKVYAQWNPLYPATMNHAHTATLSEGNLRLASSTSNYSNTLSTLVMPAGSGKFAAKFTVNTLGGIYPVIGVYDIEGSNAFVNAFTGTSDSVGLRMDGQKYVDGSSSSYGSAVSAGNTVEVELDMDNNTVEFLINGSAQGTISKTFTGTVVFMVQDGSNGSAIDVTAEFDYTPNDSNFLTLNSANLTAPTHQGCDLFKPLTYTGASGGSLIAQGLGTPIGNMTSGGGLASAFDGDVENYNGGAQRNATNGNLGKDFGSGVTKTVTGVVVKMLGNASIDGGAGTETMTLTVERSDNGTDFTTIFTESSISVAAGAVITRKSGFSNTAAARYARVSISQSGGAETHISELEFYENAADSNAVTGVGFQPDWVWIKDIGTSAGVSHALYDAVRGTTKQIESDNTSKQTTESQGLTTFGSDGFTVGTLDQLNDGGTSFISWNWEAGTAFTNDASATGIGTLDSSGRVSDAGHFSIVSYTGNNTDNASIKHGLSAAPELVIHKELDNDNGWLVGATIVGYDRMLRLDTNDRDTADSAAWSDVAPSASIITLGNGNGTNRAGAMIAFCFRSISGLCKVGSYIPNNITNGPYISLGFTPAFLLIKCVQTTNPWIIFDNARDTSNPITPYLLANSDAQQASSGRDIDLLADGFKIREDDSDTNGGTSNTYLFLAMSDLASGSGLPPIIGK